MGYVKTNDLRDDCVTNDKLAADAVDSDQIADGSIDSVHLASGSVTSTKFGPGAVTTAALGDDAVTVAKLDAAVLQSATGTIPAGNGAGNVGDLNSTPVTLVAAPGASSYIHVVSVHWFLDYVSAAYDGTKTGNLMVKYTDGSGDELTGQVAETGFMDQTADVHAAVHGVAYVPLANAPVVAHASNDWYSAAGDSPVKYEVIYRVLPIDPTA